MAWGVQEDTGLEDVSLCIYTVQYWKVNLTWPEDDLSSHFPAYFQWDCPASVKHGKQCLRESLEASIGGHMMADAVSQVIK